MEYDSISVLETEQKALSSDITTVLFQLALGYLHLPKLISFLQTNDPSSSPEPRP